MVRSAYGEIVNMSAGSPAPQANIAKGIALALAATAVFGIQDVLTKIVVQNHSPFQILMIRYWAFGVFAIWLAMRRGPLRKALVSASPRLQIFRGVLLAVDIWLFTEALRTVPLGDLSAISMTYPLMTVVFAIPLLGERVGAFGIGAVVFGFVGALLIVRPGFATIEIGILYGLLSSAIYALYLVLTRKVARVDSTTTSIIYVALIGAVMSTALGFFYWEPMEIKDALTLAGVCVTMCTAHGLVMASMRYAPASLLQPFNYFSLPWAITLGFLIFGTIIEGFAILGAIIIVLAGLAVSWRERTLAVKARASASAPVKP